MERTFSFAKLVFVLAFIATVIGSTAFSQEPGDSTSSRKELESNPDSSGSVKPSDETNRRFDLLDMELKHLDVKLDQLNIELKNEDLNKIQLEVNKAMKEVDKNRISDEVRQSIKNIDWKRINKEVNESVANVDRVQMTELKKKMEKLKTQVEKQKFNHEFSVPRIEAKKIRLQTEKAMKKARLSIENSKKEFQDLRDLTNSLEADGLIDKSKPYRIEVKSGELYINGTRQSKEVSEKYKRFYRKGNFSVNTNDADDDWI